MPSTTTYNRGDVVLVPFPFTDLSSSKHRPALIVSPDALNSARDDVVVLAITSQIPPQLTADEFMIPTADLRSTGLPKPSLLKLSKIVTLHQRLVVKQIGSLPVSTTTSVLERLRQIFS